MAISPTYPGVYIQEIPSGVRTIIGVSTSVTAFVGPAKSGPIDKAVHIFNFSEFERNFGGLYRDSEMSYAVRQFFSNGGSDAWVVRVAKNAAAATVTLKNNAGEDVLKITALDAGKTGNEIEIRVDYKTSNPASTFNLTVGDEEYLNLSMNSNDPRYVYDIIHDISRLVDVERVHNLENLGKGTSKSGALVDDENNLLDVNTLLDNRHNQLRISVNGSEPINVQIALPIVGDNTNDELDKLNKLCEITGSQVTGAANGDIAISAFTCKFDMNNNRIVMTSGKEGEESSVRVLGGLRDDAAGQLKLGTLNGGEETDAVSTIRPKEDPVPGTLTSGEPDHGTLTSGVPDHGTLTSGELAESLTLPIAGNQKFFISIDGSSPPSEIDFGSESVNGLEGIAGLIENKVRLINGGSAFEGFTCKVDPVSKKRLILASGSRGPGSKVIVSEVTGDDLAKTLKLLPSQDAQATPDFPSDDNHRFFISIDGSSPSEIDIETDPANGTDLKTKLGDIAGRIRDRVHEISTPNEAFSEFKCEVAESEDRLILSSGSKGPGSTVSVSEVTGDGLAKALKLLPSEGAQATSEFPSASNHKFFISIDGSTPTEIDIGTGPATGTDLKTKLEKIAKRIQDRVQSNQSNIAYRDFTCKVAESGNRLILSSGSRGKGSAVIVSEVSGDNLAKGLKLLPPDAIITQSNDVKLKGGNEEPFTPDEAYSIYIASRTDHKGIYALEDVDLFNLLCLPGVTESGILIDAVSYCQERRAFMIIDAPENKKKPHEMAAVVSGTALPKSDYAAVYYPWIRIADPLKGGKLRSCPPSGTIAGLYARIDSSRGVWKAPAGTEAVLTGAQAIEYPLTDAENGTLNLLGVNCIRVFPVYGVVSWGARTLQGSQQIASEYKYIPIRRLALFIEETLYRGTQWVVFEPNDEPLWAQIRLNIGSFMHSLFTQGAFQGRTPREAYFVKCDKETTTQNDINKGIVNIVVGFAPLKPAEFVIIQIQQIAGQIQV